MQKGVAGKWIVFAFGAPAHATLAGLPITGDAANITANIRLDGGAANAVDDTNPTELERGYYVFDITAVESAGNLLSLHPASATANVEVIGVPGAIYTTPPNFQALGINASGHISRVVLADAITANNDKTGYSLAAGQLDSVATQASVNDLPTNAELATALAAADDAVLAAIAALNNLSDADVESALTAYGAATASALATVLTAVQDVPTNAELTAALAAADDAVLAVLTLVKAKTDLIPAAPAAVGDIPSATANATGLLDLADSIEAGLTLRNALRLIAAATAGKVSGAETTSVVFRNAVADSKNRITATVDATGNRSSIVTDMT